MPTQFVGANGVRFAYSRWGKQGKFPLVFNQHFTGNLDNWDQAVLDGLAHEREVIIFNNAGIASSTGEVPESFEGMAKNAESFIDALGLKQVDLLGFSIGGFVAQQIVFGSARSCAQAHPRWHGTTQSKRGGWPEWSDTGDGEHLRSDV